MTGYEEQVAEYLRYCKKAAAELKLQGSSLDPKYHPTEAGAVKLIHGDEKLIRQAFREAAGQATTTRGNE